MVVIDSSKVVVDGSIVVIDGSKVVEDGSMVVIDGSKVVVDGSMVVIDGSKVVVDGSMVVIDGSKVLVDIIVVFKIFSSSIVSSSISLTYICSSSSVTLLFIRFFSFLLSESLFCIFISSR